MNRLHKIISFVLVLPLTASFTTPVRAQALLGGAITVIQPICMGAPGQVIGTVMEVGPPLPMPVMYIFSVSRSYLVKPPSTPGQWLLGMLSGFTPCMIWVSCGPTICRVPNPSLPGGGLITFHGSS